MIIHDLHWWHNTLRYLALVSGWSALNIFEQAAVNWLQTWSCWHTPESFQVCSGIQDNHEGDQREACIARNPFGTDAWRSKKHEFQNSLLQYCLPWNWSILRNWGCAGFWYLWAQQKGTGPDVELYPQKMLLGFARPLGTCSSTAGALWCTAGAMDIHGPRHHCTWKAAMLHKVELKRLCLEWFPCVSPACFWQARTAGGRAGLGRPRTQDSLVFIWRQRYPGKAKFQSLFYPAFLGSQRQHCFRFSAGRCEMLLWVCS